MIDLHSHFLPGIDDGAKDMAITLEMLRQAENLGFKRLLATPHINENTTPEILEQIQNTFQLVITEKNSTGIHLELGLAGEIYFDGHLLSWLDHNFLKIGSMKKYIIIELPIQGLPINIEDMIFKIGLKGVIPVLAHPERNIYIQQNPGRLSKWLNLGCIMPMNAGSITGDFGSAIKGLAWQLLRKQQIQLVCSDAHNTGRRSYRLQIRAYRMIMEQLGENYATSLFKSNPERIWNGHEIVLPVLSEEDINIPIHEKFIRRVKSGLKRPIMY